jgi:hypothetical protein
MISPIFSEYMGQRKIINIKESSPGQQYRREAIEGDTTAAATSAIAASTQQSRSLHSNSSLALSLSRFSLAPRHSQARVQVFILFSSTTNDLSSTVQGIRFPLVDLVHQ